MCRSPVQQAGLTFVSSFPSSPSIPLDPKTLPSSMAPGDVDSRADFHQLVQAHHAAVARLPPLEEIRTLLDRSTRGMLSTFSQVSEMMGSFLTRGLVYVTLLLTEMLHLSCYYLHCVNFYLVGEFRFASWSWDIHIQHMSALKLWKRTKGDFISMVLGLDTQGRVRGLGLGVSKTSMQHTYPYRIALREEQASRATMQAQMDKLKEMLEMRLVEEVRQRKEDMERFFTSFSQGGS